MKLKKNKGFTLIELLAVILILGIIALIAIPTVNKVLQESRVGAWQSTGNQMAKSAQNYYQLRVIKDGDYVIDFKTGETSNGKFATYDSTKKVIGYNGDVVVAADLEKIMEAALEINGDMPKLSQIEIFTLDNSGSATLKFATANSYCLSTSSSFETKAEYDAATIKADGTYAGILVKGGNIKCISK